MDNTITVKVDQLLERLTSNLSQHQAKVELAQQRYREQVVAELQQRLSDGRAGRPIDVGVFGRMPVPRSFAHEYEQAIEELRWHTGDTVEITSRDFRRYVLDKWEWEQQFHASSSAYLVE